MQKEIIMVVKAENICTIQCGDGCATNIKAADEVEKELGIKAPFSRTGEIKLTKIFNC